MNIVSIIDNQRFINYLSRYKYLLKYFSFTPKIFYLLFIFLGLYFNKTDILIFSCLCIISDIIIYILKRLIKRPRPLEIKSNTISKLTGYLPDKYSFPSAHTFTVFMILPYVISYNSFVSSIIFSIYSILVCLSRISLKHHFPSDVLFSVILGFLTGIGIIFIIFNI